MRETILSYGDLTSEEVSEALKRRPLILPVGSVEQHGPHLPLSVDVDIANAIAREIAWRTGGLLAPAITYGTRSLPASGGGPSFPGTIYARGTTLVPYVQEIVASYVRAGAQQLVVVNGHYENEYLLFEALELCRESGLLRDTRAIALSWWSIVSEGFLREILPAGFVGWHAEHAGVCETSLMMHLRPDLVRPIRVDHDRPPEAGIYVQPTDPAEISNRGVLSATTGSSASIGKALFEHVCKRIEELVVRSSSVQRATTDV